jgi:hypothetical protein
MSAARSAKHFTPFVSSSLSVKNNFESAQMPRAAKHCHADKEKRQRSDPAVPVGVTSLLSPAMTHRQDERLSRRFAFHPN